MKSLLFTVSILIIFPVKAVDFHRCEDESGITHFTNLPASSLNANCKQKNDTFSLMLNEDYQNLAQEHEKYKIKESENNNIDFAGVNNDTVLHRKDNKPTAADEEEMGLFDFIKIRTKNIFDPDVAEEELFSTIEKRDDVFTRAIRGRTKALDTVINSVDMLKSRNQKTEESLTE